MKLKLTYIIILLFLISCKREVTYKFNIVNNSSNKIIVNSNTNEIYHVIKPQKKKQILETSVLSIGSEDSIYSYKMLVKDLFVLNNNGDSLKRCLFKMNNWKLNINTNSIRPIYSYDLIISDIDFNKN